MKHINRDSLNIIILPRTLQKTLHLLFAFRNTAIIYATRAKWAFNYFSLDNCALSSNDNEQKKVKTVNMPKRCSE